MTIDLDDYYNRFDPAKKFEKHLIRAGRGVQSAEINEIQDNLLTRQKRLGDVLLSDGDIISDCQCVVDHITGAVQLEAGSLYITGAVRDVPAAAFTVAVNTVVVIGIRLTETVITELEDPTLRDPATGTRNYDEPGAARLRLSIAWGYEGDGGTGAFFPVYTVENGYLLSKEPPPTLDGVTNAIARYDRDSAGGNYIINGLSTTATYDRPNGKVIVLVTEGRARVNGFPTDLSRGLRIVYDADPDTKAIIAEPRTYTPVTGSMRVELDNPPLLGIDEVRYTRQTVETVTRGAVAGSRDPLANNSILTLVAVNQGGTWNGTAFVGGTNYTVGTNVKLTSGEVDWSLAGAEPAPGSTYTAVYQHQTTVGATITGIDDTGFTISGPVEGSLFTVDYTFALPRIDAIVFDQQGRVSRVKGVATQYNPARPSVPDTQLRIAGLSHTWDTDPVVQSDAVVVLPMQELQGLRALVFDLFDLVALERLRTEVSLRDTAAKRGVFVDPFTNDNLRDAGLSQSLAVIDGELVLAIDETVFQMGDGITVPQLLPYTIDVVIEQPYRTGSMLVNPYQAFDPVPPTMRLDPDVDFWTEVVTTWASAVTQRFVRGAGNGVLVTTTSGVSVAANTQDAQFLRQRYVDFTLTGMGAGEALTALTFDGVAVTPEAP